MTAVLLVPSHDRPYVDGSSNDSVYTQVFDYNGLGRLTGKWTAVAGPPSPLVGAAVKSGTLLTAETLGIKPSWHRLLAGPFAADTSGYVASYILYSGREVLPIGGYLGNVPAPTLATLRADISRGYVRVFVLPVSPPGPDPRVRWIEPHCARQPQPPNLRPVPYADFSCGPGTGQPGAGVAPAQSTQTSPVPATQHS
jgi:hypothetical protein